MRAPKHNPGYTLMEILLVLIILAGAGFFLLIRIPYHAQEKGIEITASRLVDDLREVQQAAIAGNVWYKVKFYPSTNEYRIFRQGNFVCTIPLQQGVSFANSPPELTFLPTGGPSTGLTVILQAGKIERKVIIAPVMGRIRLEIER